MEELVGIVSGFFLGLISLPSLGILGYAEGFQLKTAYSEVDSSYKYLWVFLLTVLLTSAVEESINAPKAK